MIKHHPTCFQRVINDPRFKHNWMGIDHIGWSYCRNGKDSLMFLGYRLMERDNITCGFWIPSLEMDSIITFFQEWTDGTIIVPVGDLIATIRSQVERYDTWLTDNEDWR